MCLRVGGPIDTGCNDLLSFLLLLLRSFQPVAPWLEWLHQVQFPDDEIVDIEIFNIGLNN